MEDKTWKRRECASATAGLVEPIRRVLCGLQRHRPLHALGLCACGGNCDQHVDSSVEGETWKWRVSAL